MTSIWQLAGMTAVIGMGVVFVALFLLSMYMHYFKLLTARLEAGRRTAPAPAPKRAKPAVAPVPDAVPTASVAPLAGDAAVAAAVAVGLHLKGVLPTAPGEVVAAIAAALALRRSRLTSSGPSAPRPAANWRLAGRLDAMHSRRRGHERPLAHRR